VVLLTHHDSPSLFVERQVPIPGYSTLAHEMGKERLRNVGTVCGSCRPDGPELLWCRQSPALEILFQNLRDWTIVPSCNQVLRQLLACWALHMTCRDGTPVKTIGSETVSSACVRCGVLPKMRPDDLLSGGICSSCLSSILTSNLGFGA